MIRHEHSGLLAEVGDHRSLAAALMLSPQLAAQPNILFLFADDELPLQELMKNELPRMGHTVTVCPDGLTAAAALDKNTYDCVLVDLDMPGLNGIEVITRAKELSPETEAIVMIGEIGGDAGVDESV